MADARGADLLLGFASDLARAGGDLELVFVLGATAAMGVTFGSSSRAALVLGEGSFLRVRLVVGSVDGSC